MSKGPTASSHRRYLSDMLDWAQQVNSLFFKIPMSKILLFYKYVAIQYPEQVRKWQLKLCQDLNLKGRIIIAHEGMNGTVGGDLQTTQAYIEAMRAHPLFSDVDFKEADGGSENFPRLRVVVKNEIVNLGIDPNITAQNGGKHLTPEQTHQLLQESPQDLVILDGRNWYESKIGTFKNAVTPNTKNFRDLPAYIDENVEQFKDKQVLMFCTGGIRCERASAYLKSKGVAKEIYQIEGGIHRYAEKYPDGFFRGKNYVFDSRIASRINDDILAHCTFCQQPCDDFTNCLNASCNIQFIVCSGCLATHGSMCNPECKKAVEEKTVPIRTKPARFTQHEKR
jgi:predicted sulfurtransferase